MTRTSPGRVLDRWLAPFFSQRKFTQILLFCRRHMRLDRICRRRLYTLHNELFFPRQWDIKFSIKYRVNTLRLWLPQLFTMINAFYAKYPDQQGDLCLIIGTNTNATQVIAEHPEDCTLVSFGEPNVEVNRNCTKILRFIENRIHCRIQRSIISSFWAQCKEFYTRWLDGS